MPHAEDIQELLRKAGVLERKHKTDRALSCYLKVLERDADHLTAAHRAAELHLALGNHGAALELAERIVGKTADRDGLYLLLARIHAGRGETDRAQGYLERCLENDGNDVDVLRYFAGFLRQQGNYDDAVGLSQRALDRGPNDKETLWEHVLILQGMGRIQAAISALERLLSLSPADHKLYFRLGVLNNRLGRLGESRKAFERAVRLRPSNPAYHATLAKVLLRSNDYTASIAAWKSALKRAPRDAEIWQDFVMSCRSFVFHEPDRELEALYAKALDREDILHDHVTIPALSLLKLQRPVGRLIEAGKQPHADAKALALLGNEKALKNLLNPLFVRLLRKVVLRDEAIERSLVALRKQLLVTVVGEAADGKADRDLFRFCCALAHQCFLNEYVYVEGPEEKARVGALREGIDRATRRGRGLRRLALAVFAAYRPLRVLKRPGSLADAPHGDTDPELAALIKTQVGDFEAEQRLGERIPRVTPLETAASDEVRRQYEENPYPRWTSIDRFEPQPVSVLMRNLFPTLTRAETPAFDGPRVLIAGCGTGLQALAAHFRYRDADITAIDISKASLAFAARKARAYGIGNITFQQADILELGDYPSRFEIIECFGVLHHLSDPLGGWRILTRLLVPGGLMMVGLYSKLGRGAVLAARSFIRDGGYPVTEDGIRKCRRDMFDLPPDHPVRDIVRPTSDFWTLSECRDLIFNVRESRFSLPEIQAMAADLDLRFLGFEFDRPDVPARYQMLNPDDPKRTSLENWAAFEKRDTSIFRGCYRMWFANPEPGN